MNGLGALYIVSRHAKQPSDKVKLSNLIRNTGLKEKIAHPTIRKADTGGYLIGE
jgi:hypothetical protein